MRISDWSSDVCSSDLIVLAGIKRRNDSVPILRNDLTLDAHATAQLSGEIHIEARELARSGLEIPWRVGALGSDSDDCPILRLHHGTGQAKGNEHHAETEGYPLHTQLLPEIGRASCRESGCQYV